jgi:hypothetical protein
MPRIDSRFLDSIAPGLIDPDPCTIRTIFKRLERVGDLFATMSKEPQDIGPFCEALHA